MSLIVTSTGTPTEPVLVTEVLARLRLTSTADNAMIGQLITVAREYAETETRQALVYQAYALTLDRFPFPNEPIRVPVPPLVAVTSLTFLDSTLTSQTWSPDDYFVADANFPALIVPVPGIIYPPTAYVPGAVQLNFTAGFGYAGNSESDPVIPPGPACPARIAEGIRQLAVHLYEHPETVTSEGLKEVPVNFRTFFGSKKVYTF